MTFKCCGSTAIVLVAFSYSFYLAKEGKIFSWHLFLFFLYFHFRIFNQDLAGYLVKSVGNN